MSTPLPLSQPLALAIAKDSYLTPLHAFADNTHIPLLSPPMYGQDITSGCRSRAPQGQSVGNNVGELKPKMLKLLGIFAGGDKTGMAKRLFDEFLSNRIGTVGYFDDANLTNAVANHPNISSFCSAVLSAPNSPHKTSGQVRIHQALKNAGWDIKKLYMPQILGVPALNLGSKVFSTRDFNNGLGLMINGVQYAYVIATHYLHDSAAKKYWITLKFVFYDVFGLDDDDLKEYGALSDSGRPFLPAIGITAWWQLQHQFGFQPLVTRVAFSKTYEAPTQ
jgi:hypothetical protein